MKDRRSGTPMNKIQRDFTTKTATKIRPKRENNENDFFAYEKDYKKFSSFNQNSNPSRLMYFFKLITGLEM